MTVVDEPLIKQQPSGNGVQNTRREAAAAPESLVSADASEADAPLRRELCPVSRAICMLEKKWTIHILYELTAGKRRFCHLQDAIGNANSRTLSERLKELEVQGLLRRDVIQSIPPWVEYSLTEKGTDLCRLIEGVAGWARKWSMFDDCWEEPDAPSLNGDNCSTCDIQGDLEAMKD